MDRGRGSNRGGWERGRGNNYRARGRGQYVRKEEESKEDKMHERMERMVDTITESTPNPTTQSDHDEMCILCYNPIKFFVLGKCDHKNVCALCGLRLRLICEDE